MRLLVPVVREMETRMDKKDIVTTTTDNVLDQLVNASIELIDYARNSVARQVNITQIMAYYTLGRWIIDCQQKGQERAQYGKKIIKTLSEKLTEQYGKGFSESYLEKARKFYIIYQTRISETLFTEFAVKKSETAFTELIKNPPFILPWSHYLQLMRIEDENERNFYEIEAANSNWSIRTLQRQYNSSLYERLALSKNKDEVMRLSKEGIVVTSPQDIVKQPTVLEFLGLEERTSYSESDLETALIDKLQKFLSLLGRRLLSSIGSEMNATLVAIMRFRASSQIRCDISKLRFSLLC